VSKFQDDLQYSHEQAQAEYWQVAYQNYFNDPDVKQEMVLPMGGNADSGIDKFVNLSNGMRFSVDEKVHRKSEKYAPNTSIFLEYRTLWNNGYETAGWCRDPFKAATVDFVSYYKEELGVVYMLPVYEIYFLINEFETSGREFAKSVATRNDVGERYYFTYNYLLPAERLFDMLNHRRQAITIPTTPSGV